MGIGVLPRGSGRVWGPVVIQANRSADSATWAARTSRLALGEAEVSDRCYVTLLWQCEEMARRRERAGPKGKELRLARFEPLRTYHYRQRPKTIPRGQPALAIRSWYLRGRE